MPIIHYIEADGAEYEADVVVGSTVMQGAVDNMIDGILAECGGSCSCATCHCYVDEAWFEKVGEAGGTEKNHAGNGYRSTAYQSFKLPD